MRVVLKVVLSVVGFFAAILTAAAALELSTGVHRPGLVPPFTLTLWALMLYLIWRRRPAR